MKKHTSPHAFLHRQGGAVLIAMMVFMALGAVLLVPMLNYIGTGLIGGKTFLNKADQYYAADAGVEDALWQVKNDTLASLTSPSAYNRYDYATDWAYQLNGANQVNNYDVGVTIGNEWMVYGQDPPIAADSKILIEGQDGNPPTMIVTGRKTGSVDADTFIYQVTLSYFPSGGNLKVQTVGIWLPTGFTYVPNSISLRYVSGGSTLTPSLAAGSPYAWKGNVALVWNLSSPLFSSLQGVTGTDPIVCKFTIQVDGSATQPLEAVPWISVDSATDLGAGQHFTWDADVNIYRIHSIATGTTTAVDAYAVQDKLRELSSAVNGDYVAVGNSLMNNPDGDAVRDNLITESPATVSGIPADANVEAAYLYWSGWTGAGDSGVQTRVPTADGDKSGTWSFPVGSTAYLNPGADGLTSGGDGNGFESNPQNAYTDNIAGGAQGNSSSRAANIDGAGDRHLYYGYNMSTVPAGSTILGIEVRLDWFLDSTQGTNSMSVELSWDGGTSWTSAKTASTERTTDGSPTNTLGSAADTWGHSNWTTAELANLRVRVTCNSTVSTRDFYLDWIPVRITYQDSSGSVYSRVDEDESTVNNNDYVVGSTNNGYCLFDFTNFSIPLGSNIDSLILYVIAKDDSGGANRIAGQIKVNGTRYTNSANNDPGSTFATYPYSWTTNPATGHAWTVSEINNLQQIGIVGSDLSPAVDVSAVYVQVNYRPDTDVTFKIDGTQVCFDTDGVTPIVGSNKIVANPLNGIDLVQIMTTPEKSGDDIFYACKKDVTDLVKAFSADADPGPGISRTGNSIYTVGDVDGTTDDEYSYAGWSLIIIYSSPDTKGHQLYLFDEMFTSVDDANQDFDHDGQPGGTISGFIVPSPVAGETVAARITAFVGEGDARYAGDDLKVNGTALNDGTSGGTTNVWNGKSVGWTGTYEGVDVDTFEVTWASGLLTPTQTSAKIDLDTQEDTWEMIYMIVSFRSSATAGGAITYLIH